MRVRNAWFAVVFPLLLGTACAGGDTTPAAGSADTTAGAAKEDLGPSLADVSGIKVYEKEFQAAAARKTPANGDSFTPEEKKEILQKLIEEKALYQEAKKKGVDQDPKVQKVMVNTLLRQEVYSGVRNSDFTQEELQAYYDAHKEEFVVPEKVQVKRVFIRIGEERDQAAAKKLADEIYAQIKADPSKFSDVASEKSEDPYRRRGGDLGFVGKDGKPGIDPAVVEKAFTMDVGALAEPFEAGGGFNVILVANKRERVERPFEQMRGSVLRKVKNEKYKEMYEKYVSGVVGNYTVTIDDAAVGAVKVEPGRAGGPMGGMPMPGGLKGPGEMDLEGGPGEPVGDEGEGSAVGEPEGAPATPGK